MELFPAIDLQNGSCVRLRQGDFADSTTYSSDPLAVVQSFQDEGATWLHLVDLDGAKDGQARQTGIISRLAKNTTLRLQAGGGLRSDVDIQALLDCGVHRVVIGSLAVSDPKLVMGWIKRFGPDRVVLAFDVRLDAEGTPQTLTQGWQAESKFSLWDLLTTYQSSGLQTILCTDVARDGMLSGPNVDLYKAIASRFPSLNLLASGGIGSLDDIRALKSANMAGAIIGKALYEKRFTLAEALTIVQKGGI